MSAAAARHDRLDALRALALLWMTGYHFAFDLNHFGHIRQNFYQDPVWPGSLGLESFLQLLKYAAWRRWGDPPAGGWQLSLGRAHSWTYRGQVLLVELQL